MKLKLVLEHLIDSPSLDRELENSGPRLYHFHGDHSFEHI